MEAINYWILVGALLMFAGVLAGSASSRFGMPLLLTFLLVGMLAGEDGPGGIDFDDIGISYLIGNVALAVILFDGGLNTRIESFRVALKPSLVLATFGVAISAGVTGGFAAWLLGIPLMHGLLIGATVGSTDAAAVFGLLSTQGVTIKRRVAATLEIESGSNDPMAIFLTVALIGMIRGDTADAWGFIRLFVEQMGIGALAGWLGGRALAWLVNRLPLEAGLYPLLALAGGLVLFAATTAAGGSGFLAIYIAGIVLGNARLRAAHTILRVHNGMAWLSQVGMFLILGLLATPSQVLRDAPRALAIAAVLIFAARPLAVWLCLLPFRFPWREQLYIAWVGLRGAVPIVLALFPLLSGVAQDKIFLHVAFVVVLISLLLQGWTLGPLARRLELEVPPASEPERRISLEDSELELVAVSLAPGSRLEGAHPGAVRLPPRSFIGAVQRGALWLPPEQAERLRAEDRVYAFAAPEEADALAGLAAGQPQARFARFFGEFTLEASARVGDVAAAYGLRGLEAEAGMTLAELLDSASHNRTVIGDRVERGGVELVVRELDADGHVTRVGLKLPR